MLMRRFMKPFGHVDTDASSVLSPKQYADLLAKDNAPLGELWDKSIDVDARRAKKASVLADDAVVESRRQGRIAREYARQAILAAESAARAIDIANSEKVHFPQFATSLEVPLAPPPKTPSKHNIGGLEEVRLTRGHSLGPMFLRVGVVAQAHETGVGIVGVQNRAHRPGGRSSRPAAVCRSSEFF
eukprot:TRINITY_DN77803_c0_g1_i1.p2 TRINITY_DN77803_c0_g1~~TRINITY_DN77803_c0_g1_i1.p2  ORF type:complete len:186 (+),score=27.11 TRINITY_DN77803_c0_g1_i1:283-840(+)